MTADIEIKNLSKTYPGGTQALKDVGLEIQKGCFFTLLGPNGAGKSTLLKILTTLVRKNSGEFYVRGINPETDFSRIQRNIGVASQENEIDPAETPLNQLVFQGRLFGASKQEAAERADVLIDMFRLGDERDKKAGVLSGGNKRRLHCALALVHNPKILFLDEPTVGMDPVARANFWEVITELNREEEITVFLTTQYLEEAEKHAAEMALLVEGAIRYSGAISAFREMVSPNSKVSLEDSYLQYLKNKGEVKK